MNYRLLKYLLLVANICISSNLLAANTARDIFFENKNQFNEIFSHSYFKLNNNIEEQIFTIRAEVDNNGCFTGNSNSVSVRFILKNISGLTQSIVGRTSGDGNKLKIVNHSGLNLSEFSGISEIYTASKTLAPNEELIITGTFSDLNPLLVNQVIANVTFRYAYFNYSGVINTQVGNDIQNLMISSSINRTPDAPGNKLFSLNYNTNTSIANVASIASNLNNYKFYVDGVEVPSTYTLNSSDPEIFNKIYTYSQLNSTCESPTSTIDIGPRPGVIAVDNNNVCFDGTVSITNAEDGVGGYVTSGIGDGGYVLPLNARYALKYSFEVSYDNGITWGTPTDASSDDSDGAKAIVVNNITSNLLIRRKAHERPTGTRSNKFSYSNVVSISVIKNNIVFPPGKTNVIAQKLDNNATTANVQLPIVSATLPNTTFKYYQQNITANGVERVEVNPSTTFTLPLGEHLFEVEATSTTSGVTCSVTELIKVIIYSASDCAAYKTRKYATHVNSWTSGLSFVTDKDSIVNGNRASAASLNGGVVLLGIGTVGVDVYFSEPDPNDSTKRILVDPTKMKGKKVVVKLGEQYSGLKVAGGISVRALKTGRTLDNLSVAPLQVGATFGVKGGILDALKGDNVFEYSFVPASSISSTGNPIEFNGIRIQLGSLIGVADLANVFHVYIEEDGLINELIEPGRVQTEEEIANTISNQAYCNLINQTIEVTPPSSLLYPEFQNDVDPDLPRLGPLENVNLKLNRSTDDAFWGNYSEVANVASALNPVIFPYYAVDDDYESYALFSTTVGVLNAQFLEAKLRQPARLGDQVQITLSYPNISVINLDLLQLGNFKLVYYLDGAKVGEEKLEEFRVMDIGLFRFRTKKRAILSKPVTFMFDKIELTQFSAVSVNLGEGLRIHDVRVNPLMAFDGQTDPKEVTKVCADQPIIIQSPDDCTTYEVSLARVVAFGDTPYQIDDNGTPLTDYNGNPIYSILDVVDITQQELEDLGIVNTLPLEKIQVSGSDSKTYYKFNILKLFRGAEYEGKLLLKIQAKRQGCTYGEAQYLRINVENCNDAIINPIIKMGSK